MSLLFPPIFDVTSLGKLPKELELIINYINSLDDTITKLLESDEQDFEHRLKQTETDFLACMVQIASAIASSKDPSKVIIQLNEIYFSALAQIENEISQEKSLGNPAAIAVLNSTEIIRDYFNLFFNENIEIYLPEYNPAFRAYVILAVCISSLMKIIKNKNRNYKNSSKLIKKCQDNIWTLESYVETIEIENDPEQRQILERVKSTEAQ